MKTRNDIVMRKPGFEQNVHVCRGIAILFIVAAHTIPSFDWSRNEMTAKVIDSLCNQSSAIFFFLAGYLFQALSNNFSAKKYYLSKIKNVLLPYLFVSLPAIYLYTMAVPRGDMYSGFYDTSIVYQVFFFLITGKHLAPLWFVPTITLFYIAGPLLVKLDRYKWFYAIIPLLLALALYMGRDGSMGPINKAIYLAPAYLFGMAFSRYREFWYNLFSRYWMPLLATCALLYMVLVLDLSGPPYLQVAMKMLMAGLAVTALKKYEALFGNYFDYIGHISFGIFFVHGYYIGIFRVIYNYAHQGVLTINNEVLPDGNLFDYLVYTVIVVGFSTLTIWLLQNSMKNRSRMFVGA